MRQSSALDTLGTTEAELAKARSDIELLKKEYAQKLGQFFARIPPSLRKALLPRVCAALFGESTYELDIVKHAQQYKFSDAVL